MRVNSNLVPNIIANLQQTQGTLNTALQQVSTGKSVTVPSDNPAAAAQMVGNTLASANLDQYTQNISTVLAQVQSADSVLSSVITSLNSAVSLGTQGANGTLNASNLQALATQVQGIVQAVVSDANSTVAGTYLFGGTATGNPPYTADPSSPTGYTYSGNSSVNSVAIGDHLNVKVNVPGDQIFSSSSADVLGSLTGLVTALQNGSQTAIASAVSNVTSALNHVSEQRVVYSNSVSQMNSQETYLQQETVSLTSQQNSLTGVDMAKAATLLSQAETANSAALAAAAKVLPNSLLNYLSSPSA